MFLNFLETKFSEVVRFEHKTNLYANNPCCIFIRYEKKTSLDSLVNFVFLFVMMKLIYFTFKIKY